MLEFKGFFIGYAETSAMIWEQIQEAQRNKAYLHIVWLNGCNTTSPNELSSLFLRLEKDNSVELKTIIFSLYPCETSQSFCWENVMRN